MLTTTSATGGNQLVTPLFDVLCEAYALAKKPLPTELLKRNSQLWAFEEGELKISSKGFGSLRIGTNRSSAQFSEEETGSVTHRLARLNYTGEGSGQVKDIVLHIYRLAENGVKIFHFKEGKMSDVTADPVPSLVVPVAWKDYRPHTRVRGQDNVDLVFLKPSGEFHQVQVSLITRNGYFYAGVQSIYQGQVVRTREALAKQMGVTSHWYSGVCSTIIPTRSDDAYPGADYAKIFPGMFAQLVEYAVTNNRSARLSDCEVAGWFPISNHLEATPEAVANGCAMVGQVAWYNLLCGYGNVIGNDGNLHFVHFKQIVDPQGRQLCKGDEFPILEPGQPVSFASKIESGKHKVSKLRFDSEAYIAPLGMKGIE